MPAWGNMPSLGSNGKEGRHDALLGGGTPSAANGVLDPSLVTPSGIDSFGTDVLCSGIVFVRSMTMAQAHPQRQNAGSPSNVRSSGNGVH